MTREEFIEVLDKEGYSYKIEGDKIVVTRGDLDGDVNFGALETLHPGVVFKNVGNVYLGSLKILHPGVEFSNGGYVNLRSLETLPSGVEFSNGGHVYLESLVGGWFDVWKGNIEGVASKRLLNVMISKGLFEK
jgi:hypothetical protein